VVLQNELWAVTVAAAERARKFHSCRRRCVRHNVLSESERFTAARTIVAAAATRISLQRRRSRPVAIIGWKQRRKAALVRSVDRSLLPSLAIWVRDEHRANVILSDFPRRRLSNNYAAETADRSAPRTAIARSCICSIRRRKRHAIHTCWRTLLTVFYQQQQLPKLLRRSIAGRIAPGCYYW